MEFILCFKQNDIKKKYKASKYKQKQRKGSTSKEAGSRIARSKEVFQKQIIDSWRETNTEEMQSNHSEKKSSRGKLTIERMIKANKIILKAKKSFPGVKKECRSN